MEQNEPVIENKPVADKAEEFTFEGSKISDNTRNNEVSEKQEEIHIPVVEQKESEVKIMMIGGGEIIEPDDTKDVMVGGGEIIEPDESITYMMKKIYLVCSSESYDNNRDNIKNEVIKNKNFVFFQSYFLLLIYRRHLRWLYMLQHQEYYRL